MKKIYFLSWLVLVSVISLTLPYRLSGQTYKLKGYIIDTLRNPVSHVFISTLDSAKGYVTSNKKGKFTLKISSRDTLLIYPQGKYREVFLTPVDDHNEVVFVLKSSDREMVFNKNVIAALELIRKKQIFEYIEKLKNPPPPYYSSIYDLIQEKFPGVQINLSTGELYVRGPNRLDADFPLLIVVDGIKDVKLTTVDPNDVKTINLIKDGKSGMYGGRAAGGVLEIITKKRTR